MVAMNRLPLMPHNVWLAVAFATGWFVAALKGDSYPLPGSTEARNIDAFLDLIVEGEGGAQGYNALVGGGRFENMSDHPGLPGGEFAAGIVRADGRPSHAAGGLQFQPGTWQGLGGIARYGSFDAAAQRAAGVDLLRQQGAYQAVVTGDVVKAAYTLRSTWEMFTTRRWAPEVVAARFDALGGTLA